MAERLKAHDWNSCIRLNVSRVRIPSSPPSVANKEHLMWMRSHSKVYQNISAEQIWKLWTDINNWPSWNADLEYCKLEQAFKVGSVFKFKPKGAPAVQISLVEIDYEKMFTDCTKFWGAKMYGKHEMRVEGSALKLSTTITFTGILKRLWIKLVAQKVVDKFALQMDTLVQLALVQKG